MQIGNEETRTLFGFVLMRESINTIVLQRMSDVDKFSKRNYGDEYLKNVSRNVSLFCYMLLVAVNRGDIDENISIHRNQCSLVHEFYIESKIVWIHYDNRRKTFRNAMCEAKSIFQTAFQFH